MQTRLGFIRNLLKSALVMEANEGRLPPPEGWDPDRKFGGLTAQQKLELGNGYAMPWEWLVKTHPDAARAFEAYLTSGPAPEYLKSYWKTDKWFVQVSAWPSHPNLLTLTNTGARINYEDGFIVDAQRKLKLNPDGTWSGDLPPETAADDDVEWSDSGDYTRQEVLKQFPRAVKRYKEQFPPDKKDVRLNKWMDVYEWNDTDGYLTANEIGSNQELLYWVPELDRWMTKDYDAGEWTPAEADVEDYEAEFEKSPAWKFWLPGGTIGDTLAAAMGKAPKRDTSLPKAVETRIKMLLNNKLGGTWEVKLGNFVWIKATKGHTKRGRDVEAQVKKIVLGELKKAGVDVDDVHVQRMSFKDD